MGSDEMGDAGTPAASRLGSIAMSPVSDRAARAGAARLEELYAAHRHSVYRYLRSLTASDEDAADLTAVTFERAFRAIDRLRPEGSPVAWLLRIARNAAIDDRRRGRPVSTLDGLREADQPRSEGTPEASYLDTERVRELRALVRRLPEAQRDAVALRYGAGLSAREIGQVIGKSNAATQKLIERALAALREAHDVER